MQAYVQQCKNTPSCTSGATHTVTHTPCPTGVTDGEGQDVNRGLYNGAAAFIVQ